MRRILSCIFVMILSNPLFAERPLSELAYAKIHDSSKSVFFTRGPYRDHSKAHSYGWRGVTPIGEERRAEIGGVVLRSEFMCKTTKGIIPNAPNIQVGGREYIIPKNLGFCIGVDENWIFFSAAIELQKSENAKTEHCEFLISQWPGGNSYFYIEEQVDKVLYRIPNDIIVLVDDWSSVLNLVVPDQKVLFYNGRIGNCITFIYQELDASYSWESATRMDVIVSQNRIDYDLSAGNIIGFKGSRIEVLRADNEGIKYKVLSYFE